MKIAVLSADTRGGVQPYVALALGLRAAGHDVVAVAPGNLVGLFAERGFEAVPLDGDFEAAVSAAAGVAERGTLATARLMLRELPRRIRTWTAQTRDALVGCDLALGGIGGMVIGHSAAEALGVTFVQAHLQPVGAPSDRYPGVLSPPPPTWSGRTGTRLSHALSERAIWMQFRGAMRRARRDTLGLSGALDLRPRQPVLYGFSEHVVPVPPDPHSGVRLTTGYWFLPPDPTWKPPPELERFLDAGPAFAVGFGSMSSADAGSLADTLDGALERTGARAVVLAGASGMRPRASGRTLTLDAVPHDWLFARAQAVVHHGGAGTTGAAIAAGRAALVVPFAVDQPFWGRRVQALGAGPEPIPRRALSAERLAAALVRLRDDAPMRDRAATLGERVGVERGVERAVARIEAIGARL